MVKTRRRVEKAYLTICKSAIIICWNGVVKHPIATIISSVIPILLAGLLFKAGVRQLFFPSAERNQFVVELWMPTGTKLEKNQSGYS